MTEEDIKRVAAKYFVPTNRAVAHYTRKAGTAAEEVPAELADLPEPVRQQIMAQIRQIRESTDRASLEAALAQFGQMMGQAPPQMQGALQYVEQVIRERLAELPEDLDAALSLGTSGFRSPMASDADRRSALQEDAR